MDSLDFLAEGIDTNKVKAEQFPPLEVLVRESFASEEHRAMLLDHEWQIAKFRQQMTPTTDARLGDQRLRIAHAEAEGWTQRTEAREAALLNIANQAHENRKSA
jgi:hypothetical protein